MYQTDQSYQPRTSIRRPVAAGGLVVGATALVFTALVVFWVQSRPVRVHPVGSAGSAPAAGLPAVDVGLGGVGVAGRGIAALVEPVSTDARVRRWLADGDFVRSLAAVVGNVAHGETPRAHVPFLAPEQPFAAADRDGMLVIDPRSYRRYDWLAEAVASVDARAAVRLYRALHGPLEAAHRALGYGGVPIDAALATALKRIESSPVRDGDIEVTPQGGIFLFADPQLESLGAVEKHLVRMGPRNTRLLQAKAREFREALGNPATEPVARGGGGAAR